MTANASTAAHDALERRLAARTLLMHPVLTAHQHREDLELVRRHAPSLRTVFARLLGYPLIVESSFARLVKTPLSRTSPLRAVHDGGGAKFGPQTYALFCLAAAALLAPGAGEQILISSFIDQIRADAAEADVSMDDTWAERRRLVAAIHLLVDWGVLTETDGTVAGWNERREEALLTIHRPLLPHLLARPLGAVTALEEVAHFAAREEDEPRRSLRRKLVEDPLVSRDELSEAERDVLSRERTELTRQLDEHFGLMLEVRAEGALAYDLEGTLSDIAFPGPGTLRQAALLVIDALTAHAEEEERLASCPPAGQAGLLFGWTVVDTCVRELAERHASAWSAAYVRDPDSLRTDVTDLLQSLSLASVQEAGLVLHPAAARFRPEVHTAAAGAGQRPKDTEPQAPAPMPLFEDTWPPQGETP